MLEFIFLNVADKMDCFASLAMTAFLGLGRCDRHSPCPGIRSLFASRPAAAFSSEKEGLL
jgi:hypothetical protein